MVVFDLTVLIRLQKLYPSGYLPGRALNQDQHNIHIRIFGMKLTNNVDLNIILPMIRSPHLEYSQFARIEMSHRFPLKSAFVCHASITG